MIKQPKIIFHHVPKCGGTAIITGLAITYYPLRLLRYGREGFSGALNARAASYSAEMHNECQYAFRRKLLSYYAEKGDSPLICGHYPFNHDFHAAHKDEWTFVTLLRDPLQRWYSEYFWNRHKDHEYRKTDLSIEEYLESRNGMMNARSFVNFFSRSEDMYETPRSQDVKQAIETLEQIDVVGCLENIDNFKARMQAKLGRTPIFFKRNKSPASQEQKKVPDKNSDFHKALLERLQGDIEIYEKTKERLGL